MKLRISSNKTRDRIIRSTVQYYLTVHQSCLPVESRGVGCLGQAGGSVGGEVHLLGQLYHGDVVVGEGEALVVCVGGHVEIPLCEASLSGGGQVVFPNSDLIIKGISCISKLTTLKLDLKLVGRCWNSHLLVLPHAVGGRDDVLGGHQGPSTVLTSSQGSQGHHPGVLVGLAHNMTHLITAGNTYGGYFRPANDSCQLFLTTFAS